MSKIRGLIQRAQRGDDQAMLLILALLEEEIGELSRLSEDPEATYDTLRSELVLAIKDGKYYNGQK